MVDTRYAREHSFWKQAVGKEATTVRAHELWQELYGGDGGPLVQVPLQIPQPPARGGSRRQVQLDQGVQKICNAVMRPAGLSAALRYPEDRKGYRDWGAVSQECKSRWRAVQRWQSASRSESSDGSSTTCHLGSSCSGGSNSSVSGHQDPPPQGGPGQRTAPVPAIATRPRPCTAIGSRRPLQEVQELAALHQTQLPEELTQLQQPRRLPRPQSAPANPRHRVKPLQAGGLPAEHAGQRRGAGPCGYPANEWMNGLNGLRPSADRGQAWRH